MNKKLSWRNFINFWKQFYDNRKHPDEKFYYPYINDLSKEDFLDKLWLWKMSFHLFSKNNQRKLALMKEDKETIRNFRKSNPSFNDLYNFSRKIFQTGVVYPVFLIHICKPNKYPIFDQNVFRAFIFITKKKIVDLPKNIRDYLNYRKFVFEIHKKHKISFRDIDKALMAFGQFLDNPQKFLK